jgi:hypothetical protein
MNHTSKHCGRNSCQLQYCAVPLAWRASRVQGAKMKISRQQVATVLRREARLGEGDSNVLIERKVDGFFWPMLQWIEALIDRNAIQSKQSENAQRASLCIGISCVQGGGKTTTTNILREMLNASGRRCAVLSLDDVYLTRQEQIKVAAASPTNPLLQVSSEYWRYVTNAAMMQSTKFYMALVPR